MARIINTPADFATYPVNQIVFRDVRQPGPRIVECQWGPQLAADGVTVVHPAEIYSLLDNGAGGWSKATALRLS